VHLVDVAAVDGHDERKVRAAARAHPHLFQFDRASHALFEAWPLGGDHPKPGWICAQQFLVDGQSKAQRFVDSMVHFRKE
jgi:hypothetical protein